MVDSLGTVGANPYQNYGYNNYGMYNTSALNDDFIANQYFSQFNGTNVDSSQVAFTGTQNNPYRNTNPQQGSSFGKGLLYGVLGGAATGAGVYKFATSPVGKKGLNEAFSKEFRKSYSALLKSNLLKETKLTPEILDELINYSKDETIKLSKKAKNYIKRNKIGDVSVYLEKLHKKINKLENGKYSNILKNLYANWDKDKKIFGGTMEKSLKTACEEGLKNFKWKTAGKWGLVAAGIIAAGTWLFAKPTS